METLLEDFIRRPETKPKLIVVYGPTACGKTAMSIRVAQALDTEIIGADSRQVYRHLDIGTGKVRPEEMEGIVHHGIDFVDPREHYSVGLFEKMATEVIAGLHARAKIPVLCGGTGLYIDAVVYGFDAPDTPPDWELRARLEAERQEHGNAHLWGHLRTLDPAAAERIHPESYRAVIRTIELVTRGLPLPRRRDYLADTRYDTLWLTPYDGDRAALYARIDGRIRGMFVEGLVAEVEGLLARGYTANDP